MNARTEPQREALSELRNWHHAVHLRFVKKIYERQILQGGHAHVEQPGNALSWKTSALSKLPGHHARFDMCRYGCECEDTDGSWRPVRKTTAIRTTKFSVYKEFLLRCQHDHRHCRLEGHSQSCGRRTRFVEDYQPCFATILAATLMMDEPPSVGEFAGAVSEEKEMTGALIKLLTTNRQEAVRTVQRLHRNLGHPTKQALVELLESRGASDEVLKVAKEYTCSSRERYRKPNASAPSSVPKASRFNEKVQADVMWLKLEKGKVPVLHLIDLATKFQAAALLRDEKAGSYCKAIERNWNKHFGPPKELITDEGRGWMNETMTQFLADRNVFHSVAPGEAHTRLGDVERRHSILHEKGCRAVPARHETLRP